MDGSSIAGAGRDAPYRASSPKVQPSTPSSDGLSAESDRMAPHKRVLQPTKSMIFKDISLHEQSRVADTPDRVPLRALGVFVTGILFGVALNKAAVYRAETIRAQFRFEDNTMLQTFLMAAATSILVMVAMSRCGARRHVEAAGRSYHTKVEGTPAVLLGATLLGSGMAVSGACPGTVYAALGAGSLGSLWTWCGGLLGAVAYGLVERRLRAFKAWKVPKAVTVHALLGVNPAASGVLLAVAFVGCAVGVGYLPGQSPDGLGRDGRSILGQDPAPAEGDGNPLHYVIWSPFVAGPMIGVLQVPLSLLLEKNLGCSSTFQMAAANLLRPARKSLGKYFEYMSYFLGGFKVWWQAVLVAGACAGSALAVLTAGHGLYYDAAEAVPALPAFLGGALLVFGGRLANGCTSGHGISGVGHQGMNSLAAVAGMFGGGIAVTAAWDALSA